MCRAAIIGVLALGLAARTDAQPSWWLVEDLRIGGADSGAAAVYDVRDIWGGRERGQARSRSRTESALHPTARCGSMTTATHGSWSTA